eukprot:jgi/Psemu1/21664/gm1.21664_g
MSSSSNSSFSGTESSSPLESKGCLEANVLSVYDLPYSDDTPVAVTLSACGLTVSSGPPLARQQGRNTFRFAPPDNASAKSNGSSSSTSTGAASVKLVAPLRELYPATLKVRVVYEDPSKYLETDLDLRQLRIHELKWLILSLRAPESAAEGVPDNGSKSIVKAAKSGSTIAEEDMTPPPTVRIKLRLLGPYRPEVAALVNFSRAWFGIVDNVEGSISRSSAAVGKNLPSVNKNLLMIPAVPVLAVLVAAFPLVAGVAAMALPFLLPAVMICVGVLATALLSGGLLYSSTKAGRSRVGGALGPLVETLVVSRPGQALVYDTGPRPTPVSVCRQVLPATMWSKLWISLVIDLIGSSSYLLPLAGEGFDVAWAPAQTVLIMAMYDATSPNLKYVSFLEELLPFTDVVPSACIGWAMEFLPIMWNDHADKNNISVDPEVTRAVAQLMTTAANVVRTRSQTAAPAAAAN